MTHGRSCERYARSDIAVNLAEIGVVNPMGKCSGRGLGNWPAGVDRAAGPRGFGRRPGRTAGRDRARAQHHQGRQSRRNVVSPGLDLIQEVNAAAGEASGRGGRRRCKGRWRRLNGPRRLAIKVYEQVRSSLVESAAERTAALDLQPEAGASLAFISPPRLACRRP